MRTETLSWYQVALELYFHRIFWEEETACHFVCTRISNIDARTQPLYRVSSRVHAVILNDRLVCWNYSLDTIVMRLEPGNIMLIEFLFLLFSVRRLIHDYLRLPFSLTLIN